MKGLGVPARIAVVLCLLPSVQPGALAQSEGETPGKPAGDEVPEIVVTGTTESGGVPSVPLGATGSRDVVGPGTLRLAPAGDINRIVQLLPALSSRPYNGGDASAPSFSIRGLPDDGLTEYTLVLIDGVPASPLPYGWTAFSFFPLASERVHAVDVLRGGFAVRYSPNTVGGVVNFITRPIPVDPLAQLTSTVGSNGYASSHFAVGGTREDCGVLLTLVDKSGDGYRKDGAFSMEDLSLKVRLDPGKGEWLQATLSYFTDEHKAPGGLTPSEYAIDRFGNSRPENRFNGFRSLLDVVAHRGIGPGAWIEAFGSYSRTARRLHAFPEAGPPVSVENWSDESVTTILGARGGRRVSALGLDHELYAGVRGQEEHIPSWRIVSDPYAPGPDVPLQDRSYSLYAWSAHLDDTVHPVRNLTVTAGVRAEWIPVARGRDEFGTVAFRDRFFAVLPGADASYEATDSVAFYGNWHRSFRAPQVWGFDFTGVRQDLDFERGTSLEGGARVKAPGGLTGSLAAWRVDFDDVATFDRGYYSNFGRIVARGLDAVADWDAGAVAERLKGLRLRGSWTLQDSELREGVFRGQTTPYAWRSKVTWGASYETEDRWAFSVDGSRVGPTWSDEAHSPEDPTGFLGRNRAVTLWNAKVSRVFPLSKDAEAEVAMGVTNLLDSERFVHSRGGFFGGGRVAYAPRQAFVSVGLSLWF